MQYRSFNSIDLTVRRAWDQYLSKSPVGQSLVGVMSTSPAVVTVVSTVDPGERGQYRVVGFFAPETVVLNDPPPGQYDLITNLLDTSMFKVYSDMMTSESLLIQQRKPTKFGYLLMMTVVTMGVLNTESFCESVWSCLKLVVSDLHVCLKTDEIRILVMGLED